MKILYGRADFHGKYLRIAPGQNCTIRAVSSKKPLCEEHVMPGSAYEKVMEIAAEQFGYLTTSQAQERGASDNALRMMAKRGTLERVSWGVYRLPTFPSSPYAEYMEASLWPAGVAGVISHQSALALRGLSDVNPSRVHTTVPIDFRIRRDIPAHLVVHNAELSDEDVTLFEGLQTTTVRRTIEDCHRRPPWTRAPSPGARAGRTRGVPETCRSSRAQEAGASGARANDEPMTGRKRPPTSARVLTRWVDAYARERGLAPKRVREWIPYMVLGGRLECVSATTGGPWFTIKGAVALDMRLPLRARATKDIDLVVDDLGERDLASALRDALEESYQGFAFRVKGEPYVMPNHSVRVEVALDYKGRSWGTLQVDLSPHEGDRTEVELVEPLRLEPFGLDTPDALPCLALRYHVAQKIHAMTEPSRDESTPNERFRDLVDVLLMRELTSGLGGVRAACVEVFTIRGAHGWPPILDPPSFWEEPFAKLAEEVELPMRILGMAVQEAQMFVEAIDAAGSQ